MMKDTNCVTEICLLTVVTHHSDHPFGRYAVSYSKHHTIIISMHRTWPTKKSFRICDMILFNNQYPTSDLCEPCQCTHAVSTNMKCVIVSFESFKHLICCTNLQQNIHKLSSSVYLSEIKVKGKQFIRGSM